MRVHAKVGAGARKERFASIGENAFEIFVREKAERNEANDRVRKLLSLHFCVPVSSVRCISGMRGKTKTFDVTQ